VLRRPVSPPAPFPVPRYLARMQELAATDTEDPALNYGVVVDCGSSGSRVFVYFWPPHNGNPHDLLDIRQMRDRSSRPVVKKIKPGRCRPIPPPAGGVRLVPAVGLGWFTASLAPGQASPRRRRPPPSTLPPTCARCSGSRQPTSRRGSTRKRRSTSCARPGCGCCPSGESIHPPSSGSWGPPGIPQPRPGRRREPPGLAGLDTGRVAAGFPLALALLQWSIAGEGVLASAPLLRPCRQQAAILEDLVRNVPLEFDFLFSKSHAEVISGKQEGRNRRGALLASL